MIDFDDFLDKYYEELRNISKTMDINKMQYSEIIDKIKKNIENKPHSYYKNKPEETKQPPKEKTENNESNINKKIKTMEIGQNNLELATQYSSYYKYKVSTNKIGTDKRMNYVFEMDNNFFKKIFKKNKDRFSIKNSDVNHYNVTFIYKPKTENIVLEIDGEKKLVNFKPFKIDVTTEGCYFFLTKYKGNNKEILKFKYILDIDKMINKLKEKTKELNLSEKAISNMENSLRNHLQSLYLFNSNGFEVFDDIQEEIPLIILDDYDDDLLSDSLSSYIE